jgi:CheY-like chemotaxis protein/HPt (histidine-containing phosphotransfer) domain-containing protein
MRAKDGMTTAPFLLLVEDDPTSRAFLRAALRALPAVVDCAGSAGEALECARVRSHDLWLIDAHLPDADGPTLLALLRSTGATVPALAHTAAVDATLFQSLRSRGFADVIGKPVSAGRLHAIVRRHLGAGESGVAMPGGGRACEGAPAWDDTAALAVLNGNAADVATLRGLFVTELPAQRDGVVQAARAGDVAALLALLHRLRASCGFTGAARLAQATKALSAAAGCALALREFERAVEATLAEPAGVRTGE